MINKIDLRDYLADRKFWNGPEEHISSITERDNKLIISLYLYPTSSFLATKTLNLNDFVLWFRTRKIKKIISNV